MGVGTGTLLLGTSLAALVSFCDFPGRSWIEWVLVLPLAMPGYVFTLFALGLDVPNIRSAGGAVVIFTLVLYPYVYLLARSAFLSQSRTLMEAARGLGLSRGAAIVRVGLPLARPAILGGVALALMETLADFGTVNLLGVRTFTDAIYRVWFNAFDREAAMQFATILMSITLLLLLLERLARGRARYHYNASRGDVIPPIRLRGPAAVAAVVLPLLLVGVVLAAPVAQLSVWAVQSIQNHLLGPEFATEARNSLLLSAMSAVLVPLVALALAYGVRSSRSRTAGGAARLATIGYGLPGSVVAVAVIVPLAWLDHRLGDAAGALFGVDLGLIFTGTVIGLFCAYLVRFLALAWGAVESSLARIPTPAGRGRARARRGPHRRDRARARAAHAHRAHHRHAAGVHRGDEGAARHPSAAAAGRRHAGGGGVAGHHRVALPDGGAAGSADRAGGPRAGGPHDPALRAPRRRARGGRELDRGRAGGGARVSDGAARIGVEGLRRRARRGGGDARDRAAAS